MPRGNRDMPRSPLYAGICIYYTEDKNARISIGYSIFICIPMEFTKF